MEPWGVPGGRRWVGTLRRAAKGGVELFLGEHHHSLDGKGRVIFPSRMRDELGPQVVVSKGIDRCLHVFPIKEWERQVERVRSLATTNRNARNYARFFFSQAAPAEVDKQGRLTVPQAFRDYAGLDREVVVAGNGDRVEIWDAARWSQHVTEVESGIEDFASELGI